MFKRLMEFVKRLFGRIPGEIKPHPHIESDQGEREYCEHLMDGESRHVGEKPREYN